MSELKWWQTAVFYQIYPRSFADGNGDGIGDFEGIIEKLDYLAELGIDALWLSPHFPSPNWDCGYDVSDYCDVAPEYGTLADFRRFLAEAHGRGLRVILDLVLNHTSDQHPWFLESKSSRDNPKADWYVWYDAPPNNWQSCFDGDAWTYAPERDQVYYHYFMKQQPDLNWRNPAVKQAMWDAVRFWLDLGVDGFRLDAVGTIFEDPDLTPHTVPMTLAELRRFSETAVTPAEKALEEQVLARDVPAPVGRPRAARSDEGAARHPGRIPRRPHAGGRGRRHRLPGQRRRRAAPGVQLPADAHGAHDAGAHPRRTRRSAWRSSTRCRRAAGAATRWATTTRRASSPVTPPRLQTPPALARLNAALVLTLRGTPFLYNGEEIGMTDLIITDPGKLRDTMATWYYGALINDLKIDPVEAAVRAGAMSRDKNRTPMQWSDQPNAGFCPAGVTPWLPINPNYAAGVNVRDQQDDPGSLLNFYRRLIEVRRQVPALVAGEYRPLHEATDGYVAFLRTTETQTVLVLLNYSNARHDLRFDVPGKQTARVRFSSGRNDGDLSLAASGLDAYEVLIAELR